MTWPGHARRSRHTVEVEHTATSMPGEVFADLICEWGDPSVFNGDMVERFKAMDNMK